MSNDEVIEKVMLAKSGDKAAFSDIYKHFYQPVFRFVNFKLGGDKDKTEDIVSETYLKWYKSIERYEIKGNPLNYLFLIANRIIINEGIRKKADTLDEEMEDKIESNEKDIVESLNTKYEFEKIDEIVKSNLNENEREIIYLKYKEEKENTEIAEITGKTENNIRQIEWRALKKIRETYKQKYEN